MMITIFKVSIHYKYSAICFQFECNKKNCCEYFLFVHQLRTYIKKYFCTVADLYVTGYFWFIEINYLKFTIYFKLV